MPFHELKRRVLALLIVAGVCIVSLSPRVEPDRDADADWSLSHVVEQTDSSSAAATKTETVYINLSANGIVNKVNVTDHLHTEYPQVREDGGRTGVLVQYQRGGSLYRPVRGEL